MSSEGSDGAPGQGRFATRLLFFAAACFALYAIFAFQLDRRPALKVVTISVAVLLAAATRLQPGARTNVALLVVPMIAALHGFELYLTRIKPPAGSAAARAGRAWDNRSIWDVTRELRDKGVRAYTSVQPRPLIELQRGGISAGGVETITLGGVSSTTTVYCNEGGKWIVYESDEHGFVNPKGLWGAPVEIGMLGDSYTHGACVMPEESHAGRVRTKHPATINLGMGGNGPLLELAGIREYFSVLRPKIVLWYYFRNDLDDFNVEKRYPLLMRYLDPGFKQGLFEKQPAIDEALKKLVDELERGASAWPRPLSSLGLTRESTPIFLQDLVMGEANSAGSAFLRLDHLAYMFASRAAAEPPDLPLFEKVLRQAKAEVAAWGGTLVFVYLPDQWSIGKRGNKPHVLREPVLAAARAAALPIIDVHAAYDKEPDLESLQYHPNSHCNPQGYGVIGDVVNAWLAANRL